MKRKKHLFSWCAWLYLFMLWNPFHLGSQDAGYHSAYRPIAVSPGSETTVVTISQGCPTLSWSSIEQAISYRLVIFPSRDGLLLSYEEIRCQSIPVLLHNITGPALSWTVPFEKQLQNHTIYIWYVQALGNSGEALGAWSIGKIFRVDSTSVSSRFAGKPETSTNTSDFFNTGENSGSTGSLPETNSTIGQRDGVQGQELTNNTFYGSQAGINTVGLHNSFFGTIAGRLTTYGDNCLFFGHGSGYNTLTGVDNIFIGYLSGYDNGSGYDNIFIGHKSGTANTIGQLNTSIGTLAMGGNTTGKYNCAYGNTCGFGNTTGNYNLFFGYLAGDSNQNSSKNTFVGDSVGWIHTNGDNNSFLGGIAASAHASGEGNCFFGAFTAFGNQTGSYNTIIGGGAGEENVSSAGNVFLGYRAGYHELTNNKLYIDNSGLVSPLLYGDFENTSLTVTGKLGINTPNPDYSMEVNTTGSNASVVVKRTDGATNYVYATGSYANFGSVSNHPLRLMVNSTARLVLNTDNSMTLTNGASCTSGGVWTNASSRVLKENIHSLDANSAAVVLKQLEPVIYNYKSDKSEQYVGFIAEDVPLLVATQNRKGLSPMDITAVLTRVVQEQQHLDLVQLRMLQKEQQAIQKLQKDYQTYQKTLTAIQTQLTQWEKKK